MSKINKIIKKKLVSKKDQVTKKLKKNNPYTVDYNDPLTMDSSISAKGKKKVLTENMISIDFYNSIHRDKKLHPNDILYVGIDASLKQTAIATIKLDKIDFSIKNSLIETYSIPTEKYNFQTLWRRISFIKNTLSDILLEIQNKYPNHTIVICLEWYAMFGNTIVKLAELGGVIRLFLDESKFEFIDIPPTSLKKYITGSGIASKSEMITHVQKLTLYDVDKNEDEADALACALYLWDTIAKKRRF